MAIYEVTSTEVVQRCGKCNAENRIPVTGIEVGIAHEAQTDARTIPLPACPTCGSSEFLIRSPDDEPEYPAPGTFGHLHRMLVDDLHAELVKADKVIPALLDSLGHADPTLARPVEQAARDRWFPSGMKVGASAVEAVSVPVPVVEPVPAPEPVIAPEPLPEPVIAPIEEGQ
jgi:hypothetical protein